jgi:hypothetical protein
MRDCRICLCDHAEDIHEATERLHQAWRIDLMAAIGPVAIGKAKRGVGESWPATPEKRWKRGEER